MGGNVFKGKTQPIKKEHIEPTVEMYFKELAKVFPKKAKDFNKEHFKYVGSVGKKDYSGDIDFAVDVTEIDLSPWELNVEKVKTYYQTFKKRARTATDDELMNRAMLKGIVDTINEKAENIYCDEKKITAGNIFGYFPQYDENYNKLDYGVQIDWMVGNLSWLEFSYYSEVYEGNVKGLHRTQLMLAMFDNLGYSFNHVSGLTEKGNKNIVASTPKQAIEVLTKQYNVLFTDVNNYFALYDEFKKGVTNIEYQRVMDIYLKILDRTRCDIPDNLQNYWKQNQIRLNLTGKFLPEDSNLLKGLECQV